MNTTHTPTPWGLKNAYPGTSLNYYQIFDADGDGVLGQDSVTMDEFSILEATAKRIVECVNAMEGIPNPSNLRKTWEAIQHLELDKYHNLKEVIQNMIDRLDEGGEMTLTKDSIIVHCLKEAIK